MIEVYLKLFVGSELDYEGIVLHQTGWAVVQACKEPYHSQAVGYPRGKAAPKNSEYYGCHIDCCVTMYNEKVLNPVQTWLPGFSAICLYTTIGMASYYVARRGNRLILNMVDAPRSKIFHKEEMIDKALDFIHQQRADGFNVLVHCNQGESRGPSIALLYMAARLRVLPTDSYEAAKQEFSKRYPYFNPKIGIEGHLRDFWQQYCADGNRNQYHGS